MKKRVAGIALAMLMLLQFALVSSAQNRASFELVSLGVLEAELSGDEMLAETLTRGGFAQLMARLVCELEEIGGLQSRFVDVPVTAPYYDSVALLESMGFFEGDGDGRFRPEASVSGVEAVKTMIYCLGYETVAIARGGYPDGYLSMAVQLGLLKQVTLREEMTRGDVVWMIYNALDVTPYRGSDKVILSPDQTLRETLANRGQSELIQGRGILRATREAYINAAIPRIEDDQVDIEGVLFVCGGMEAGRYLGMEVDYRARYDASEGTYRLTGLRATSKNEVTDILAEDFVSARGGTVTYYDEDNEATAAYQSSARLVRNNRACEAYTDEDIKTDNGFIRLIDNNADGAADVILVTEYASGVLERINGGILYLEPGSDVWGMRTIAVDDGDKRVAYDLRNADGAPIAWEEVEPGCVVSVALSDDRSYYGITISDRTAEGRVTGWSEEDGIELGGIWYKLETGRALDCRVGDDVILHLNFEGRAVAAKKAAAAKKYGYVIGMDVSGLGNCQIKLVNAGTLRAEEKVDNSDPDNPVTTRLLRAGNTSIEKLTLAPKVTIDGSVMEAEEAAAMLAQNALMEYTLNAEGQLRRIRYPVKSGTGEERYYNAYEKTFGKLGDSVFAASEDTRVICVPSNDGCGDRDLLARIEMDVNDQKYHISGYDVDEKTGYADLVVLYASLSADAMDPISDKNEPALVENVVNLIDENGDERRRVDFWSEGKKQSCYIADFALSDADILKLTPGCIFYYALTNAEEIGKVEILEHIDPAPAWYKVGNASSTMKLFGRIDSMQYDALSFEKNRFVHKMKVLTSLDGADSASVDINVRNTPCIYLYQTNKGRVDVIGPLDVLASGRDRRVFTYVKNNEAELFVVVE